MPPIVTDNKVIEVLYLRNFQPSGFRATGVLSNRTYNYHAQQTGSPCDSSFTQELDDNLIYQSPVDFVVSDFFDELLIPNMGFLRFYNIEWFNALTGDLVAESVTVSDDIEGNMLLAIPADVVLTGDESQPILFFQVYPVDES